MKNIRFFYLKIFIFLVVKFSVYLNRHVFVMMAFTVLEMHSIWYVQIMGVLAIKPFQILTGMQKVCMLISVFLLLI